MRERRRRRRREVGEEDVTSKLLEMRRDLEHGVSQGIASLDMLVQQNEELKKNRDTTGDVQTGLTTGLGVLKSMSHEEKLNFYAAASGFGVFLVVCLIVLWKRSSLLWPAFFLGFCLLLLIFVIILRTCKNSFLTRFI